ncbi:GNAT family N-acetyltransferase [Bacillus salitolerans]|uniref:GNAT family N-acetyltransferase n=1 Tax=Bacillus salitolerans TaxID=1437434 RepID=A0ABW4LMF4_9BACI
MIQKNELLIRHMNGNDFGAMVRWLSDPKVLEFYEEQPSSLDTVRKKYTPRIEGKHYVIPCIVEYRNEPIGYIQFYEIQETELLNYGYTANQNIYGIDQFIGETHLWGKGIGTSMILMMIQYLSNNKDASTVVLEVKKNNNRAFSSYMKCGFRKVKSLENDLFLMEWKKTID